MSALTTACLKEETLKNREVELIDLHLLAPLFESPSLSVSLQRKIVLLECECANCLPAFPSTFCLHLEYVINGLYSENRNFQTILILQGFDNPTHFVS